MKPLETIDAETLMNQPIEPVKFLVDNLLSQGLFLLAGAPKVGKSWMALQLCLCIGKGELFLGGSTKQSGVLYLCLEDSFARIQSRLYDITDDCPATIHFAITAGSINGGLEEQIAKFKSIHMETSLVIIDTLQKIREPSSDAAYASDYKELAILKSLADRLKITILLIHHLRKTKDNDPFNMISGTTGISGCVDGSFVLFEKKRGERKATLFSVGRDIQNQEREIMFNPISHCWDLTDGNVTPLVKDDVVAIISNFISANGSFSGTASALMEKLQPQFKQQLFANTFTKLIMQNASELETVGIKISNRRSHGVRILTLTGAGSLKKTEPL